MITFIDINEKERQARSLIVVTDKGKDFVEAEFKSRNPESDRVWQEYYPLLEFQKLNSTLVLPRKIIGAD